MKYNKAAWKLLTVLVLTSLLVGGLVSLPGCSEIVQANDNGLIIEDADSTKKFDLVPSAQLSVAASILEPKIILEYANSIQRKTLTPLPSELVTITNMVSPKVIIEYANSTYHPDLENPPAGFIELTYNVLPRILIEYANSICGHSLYEPFATNNQPNQPYNLSPTDGETEVSTTTTLESTAFSDPDLSDNHAASQWQIREASGDYSNPTFDSGTDTANLTSTPLSSGILDYSITYYWRVRHQDNHGAWSEYSIETSFTTTIITIDFPTMTTNAATDKEKNTATLNGQIEDCGGENCDYCGFVWAESSYTDPDNTAPWDTNYDSNWTETGSHGTGAFSHGISELNEDTEYYFRACAHNSAGWRYGDELSFTTSPSADNPPTCLIELCAQSTTSQIGTVDVAEFFDIYVGSSTDDTDITEVRFSSDDFQDGNPMGEWTGWYDWNVSSGDWNAAAKTEAWSFATGGLKEVWAEVKDSAGQTDSDSANIKAIYTPNPCGYRFVNYGVRKDNTLTFWNNEGLSENSKNQIFDAVFDQSTIQDTETKRELMDSFGLGPKDDSFYGGNCYGMAVSSLMEYSYPDHDPFGLDPQEEIPTYRLNEDGSDPKEVQEWLSNIINWDASDDNGGITDNPVLERILKFQISQYCKEAKNNRLDYSNDTTGLIHFLEAEIANNKMYAIAIGYYYNDDGVKKDSGHALIPYRVDNAENNIYVYDPNHPDDNSRYINVDAGTWLYNMGWTMWPPSNAIDQVIILIPIEKLFNNGSQTVTPVNVGGSLFSLEGGANLVLSDAEGRTTGFIDEEFIKEIPGLKRIDPIDSLPNGEGYASTQQIYYMDDDAQLTSTIQGTVTAPYSLTKFGPSYFGDISGSFSEDGEIHTITFSSDEAGLRFSRERVLGKAELRQSSEQATYSITLHKNIDGTGQTVSATDIPVPVTPDAAHNYTIDWEALAAGEEAVTIKKDSDGDGEFEEIIVTSQPNIPSNPSPANNMTVVFLDTNLNWESGDPDISDNVTYEVFFGTNTTPPLVETVGPFAANQTSLSYALDQLSPGTTYHWQIVARDNYGITIEGPVWKFTTTFTSYNITLAADWSLVSLPLIPDNTDIDAVINAANLASGNLANIVMVYTFNTTTESWMWWNGSPASTLNTMEDGRGYWVYTTAADTLTVHGTEAGHPGADYPVLTGWNMIGFTSTSDMAPETYLASVVGKYTMPYCWDNGGWLWWMNGNPASTFTNMEPTYGYWLYMNTDGLITPP